jgi:hypothetical protein
MEDRNIPDPLGRLGPLGPISRPGNPGTPVPEVDAEDVKAACKLYGEHDMIGIRIIQGACKPGADVMAVSYRAVALRLFMDIQTQSENEPLPWKKVELNDAALRVVAQIPMQWQAPGRQENSFFFDIDDFIRRLGEAA